MMQAEQKMTFGKQLRQLREAAGLTQEQLAERAGLTAKGISALERGERQRPYPHTVQALAAALGLSAAAHEALLAALPRRATTTDEPTAFDDSLPAPLTPLVGRRQDVENVCHWLQQTPVRLLTVTGPGGVGKTRLAAHVGSLLAPHFADGVVFVALAAVPDPALVISSIAAVLHLRESSDRPLPDILAAFLRPKQLLLILDNFEHVAEAAPQIAALLDASPQLRVLATSRTRLRLRAEQEYALPPLALPSLVHLPPVEEANNTPAVALFVQCAQATLPDYALTPENVTAVTTICHRLDGLPLAIELAAARVKLLGTNMLLARLDQALSLLAGAPRDLPERQQTLHQTVAWSDALLSPGGRQLFHRLAVFSGGWTLDAAEAICPEPGAANELLGELANLLDNNLITQQESAAGEPRFGFLATIRAYAAEQLAASGEHDTMRQRHALYYLALVEQMGQALYGREQPFYLDRLAQQHDNVQAAFSWFWSQADAASMARMGWALWRFWYMRGFLGEGRRWLERTLALPGELGPPLRARALFVLGFALHEQGQTDRAAALMEESIAASAGADLPAHAMALCVHGVIQVIQGALAGAGESLLESARLAAAIDDKVVGGIALSTLGQVAMAEGNFTAAARWLDEAEPMLRQAGSLMELAIHLDIRAMMPQVQGDYRRTAELLRESLALSWQLRDTGSMVFALEGLAGSLAGLGEAETAARLFGAAEALREMLGAFGRVSEDAEMIYHRQVALVRSQLEPQQLAAAWQQGRKMRLRDVVALALVNNFALSET